MFGLFSKTKHSIDSEVENSKEDVSTTAPIAIGSYRIVPTTYGSTFGYAVEVYGVSRRPYEDGLSWERWTDHGSSNWCYETQEQAQEAYEKTVKAQHQVLMHLATPPLGPFNPYHHMLEEVKQYGLSASLETDKTNLRLQYLVFESQEDLNLYKLSGKYLETSNLVFKAKSST